MERFICTHCGDYATKATIVDNIFVCGDQECLIELTNEYFINNTIDIDVINDDYDKDFLDE